MLFFANVSSDEINYKLYRLLQQQPAISQRELSRALGLSLGKTNYCIKALIEKGFVKAHNFKNKQNKWAYTYLLTPKGIAEKARVTQRFLERKKNEYDQLKQQIEQLQMEVAEQNKFLTDWRNPKE